MRFTFVFCLSLLAMATMAQTTPATTTEAAKPAQPTTSQTNFVVEREGKIYVQTTTISQIEATSDMVSAKIESIEKQKEEALEKIKQMDKSIAELRNLYYDILKKEKKLLKKSDAKDEKPGN